MKVSSRVTENWSQERLLLSSGLASLRIKSLEPRIRLLVELIKDIDQISDEEFNTVQDLVQSLEVLLNIIKMKRLAGT